MFYLIEIPKENLFYIAEEEDVEDKEAERNNTITFWRNNELEDGKFLYKSDKREKVIEIKRKLESKRNSSVGKEIPPENPKDDIEGRNEDKSAEELKRIDDGESVSKETKSRNVGEAKKNGKKVPEDANKNGDEELPQPGPSGVSKKITEKKADEGQKKGSKRPAPAKKSKQPKKRRTGKSKPQEEPEEVDLSEDDKDKENEEDEVESAEGEYEDSDEEDLEKQLLGKNFEDDMRELQLKNKPASGVWCRADNYKKKKFCNRATGYARKLLPGIFKLSYIVKGTRSGQTCHSMDQYKNQDVLKLHPKAMDTMIKFAIAVGKAKGWPSATYREVGENVSSEIVDLKSKVKDGRLKLDDDKKKTDDESQNEQPLP